MKVIVVGLGIQGKKRLQIAGNHCVATVDPLQPDAKYRSVFDVPITSYDAALVCTPDNCKIEILHYLLSSKKHVLVEKPLMTSSTSDLEKLLQIAQSNQVTCYTAYNHRFEPHFIRMKEWLDSGKLGRLYHCRLFYGNGTARDVRNSLWRDQGAGVITDLGSHLLDTLFFWFGYTFPHFHLNRCHRFENQSPDHAIVSAEKESLFVELEMSLLSWRNHFTCDLFGEHGSAHIESLCKWGPTKWTIRSRKLPSGRPNEETVTLIQPDPTWVEEYKYFQEICKKGHTNLMGDMAINEAFQQLFSTTPCETP